MSMPRKIDRLPAPAEARQMKVIVASPSRSGILGLYRAMQILGYKSYHIYECCMVHGEPHIEVFKEAMTAQFNRLSGIRRYTKADLDKWLAEYDCLVEIPSYVGMDVIKAYAQDPNVKFILTERDPEKWAKSINNTAAKLAEAGDRFPLSILKHFDATLYSFLTMNQLACTALAGGTKPGDPDNELMLCKYYTEYIKAAKETIPADRLCLIRLEDGLGWEQICPFLDKPMPDEPYPGRNEPEVFKALVDDFMNPCITRAMLRLSAVAVPALGVFAWMSMKYGPSLLGYFGRQLFTLVRWVVGSDNL